MPFPVPPPFDVDHYRQGYDDLKGLSVEEAREHYEAQGRAEGRVAAAFALRENLLAAVGPECSVLEIGPFCRPLLTGPNVRYLDVLNARQLRARAEKLNMDPAGCPEVIHYVGGLEQVPEMFDVVVSSHAVEHQPDLVRHLREIERILKPDGAFLLVIPDKRYCFDHFMAESSIADVLQAYRERRRVHSLASVIEHGALTTHNDSGRHWRGDHGDPRQSRAERIRAAIERHDASAGGYVDVHAWYFTPGSFRDIVENLGALGLTGLEAAVYDPAYGRNEFCAILRLGPAAARRARTRQHGIELVVLQTADPFRYARMLEVTARTAIEFCRRHGHRYESFVGIKRGAHSWQATYNRIVQFKELLDGGFTGWALYLDADAHVHDLEFDLAAYLSDKTNRAAIFATSGVTGAHWDVNAGVALINFAHPEGRRLVQEWWAAFQAISDERLAQAEQWLDADNDQDLLHQILRKTPAIADAVLVESMEFMNSRHARFIRQHLRAQTADFDARVRGIADEVAAVLRCHNSPLPAPPSPMEERWRSRLRHPVESEVELVERPVPEGVDPALARRIVAAWQAAGDKGAAPAAQAGFADALAHGDEAAVAAELAGLGRARLGEGFLGGLRQHERARDALFARRLAAWTYDHLLSLAEATGALALENPEAGPWGDTARTPADALFHRVEDALGFDLAPPGHFGGYLGIAGGNGVVLHIRMIEAIHAAWRLRQLCEATGAWRVCEIGGGAGLTAFYARRLGIADYAVVDSPTMNAVQGFVLEGTGSGDQVALHGEAGRDRACRVLPIAAFETLGSIDILFNQDTLPAMGRDAALDLLATARRLGARQFLSMNQEAPLPLRSGHQQPVRALVAEAGGFRPAHRHRHWLRAGYVEELFVSAGG